MKSEGVQQAVPPAMCQITAPANDSQVPAGTVVAVQGTARADVGGNVTVNSILIDALGNQSPPTPFGAMRNGTGWTVNIPTPNDGVTVSVRFVMITAQQDCTDTVTINLSAP
jgi:hypothetical protein